MLLKLFTFYTLWTASNSCVESLQCLLQDGTSCPTNLCPNSTVLYTCDIPPLSSQLGFSVWSFSRTAGNCTMSKIHLLQPKNLPGASCTANQTTPCGQYTASISTPCTTMSLLVRVTQDLNGIIIHCLNLDASSGSTVDLGHTSITVAAVSKTAPGSPTIHVQPSCTELSVGWYPSTTGDPATSFTAYIERSGTNELVTVEDGTSYLLYFNGLESNTLYTITVTATNCAGSSEVNKTVYTLPTPPHGVQAIHVVIGTSNAHVVVIWNQMNGLSKQWYELSISYDKGIPLLTINVSCDGSICYYSVHLSTTSVPPPYAVKMATISNGQIGPYSLPVESVASSSSILYVTSSAQYTTANITCIFLDGSSQQCLICCQHEHDGQYTISLLINYSGMVVSGVLSNLNWGHTYQCIADAGDKSTVCGRTVTNGVVQFNIATLPQIIIVVGTISTEVTTQDYEHTTVMCTFHDGLSHYCLLCCSTDPSIQVSAYSNISSISGSVVTVSLYVKPGAVYYCKASAADDVTTSCPADQGLVIYMYLAIGIGTPLVSVILLMLLLYGCYAIKRRKSLIPSIRITFWKSTQDKQSDSSPSSVKCGADGKSHNSPQNKIMHSEKTEDDSYSYIKAKHSRHAVDRAPPNVEVVIPSQITYEKYDYVKTQRSAALLKPSPVIQANPYSTSSETYLESVREFRGNNC